MEFDGEKTVRFARLSQTLAQFISVQYRLFSILLKKKILALFSTLRLLAKEAADKETNQTVLKLIYSTRYSKI